MQMLPMWEGKYLLYDFKAKRFADEYEKNDVLLKFVVFDKRYIVSNWELKGEKAIKGVFNTLKGAKKFMLKSHEEKWKEKIDFLIRKQENRLGLKVIEKQFDDRKHLHVLFKRESDESYVVWTSIYVGNDSKTYESFYNGMYGLSLKEGAEELNRRYHRNLFDNKDQQYRNDDFGANKNGKKKRTEIER